MIKVHGIKNCSTVKKALDWLNEHELDYEFHDFKKSGVSPGKLKEWSAQVGWERLLNKRGTTWRTLSDDQKSGLTSEQAALTVMESNTSVIKRPVIEKGGKIIQGYDEDELRIFFGK